MGIALKAKPYLNDGWIRLHRRIMENRYWSSEPFTRAMAWIELLLLANHTTGYIRKRGILIEVQRGQVGLSEESLAARWKWSRGKVTRFLSELIKTHQISRLPVQQNPKLSCLITITNYDLYQSTDTIAGTTNEQLTDNKRYRNNNNKNDKNDKNKIFLSGCMEVRLSEFLLDRILSRNPGFKKPNIQTWAKGMDRMLSVDNRSPEDVRNVITWCQDDPFWRNNILSVEKLRKQFDQLFLKMRSNRNGNGIGNAFIKTNNPQSDGQPYPADKEY